MTPSGYLNTMQILTFTMVPIWQHSAGSSRVGRQALQHRLITADRLIHGQLSIFPSRVLHMAIPKTRHRTVVMPPVRNIEPLTHIIPHIIHSVLIDANIVDKNMSRAGIFSVADFSKDFAVGYAGQCNRRIPYAGNIICPQPLPFFGRGTFL